jgi:hypothetical protein
MANIIKQAEQEYYKIYNVTKVGNILPHALFPDNFEYYFFAFELESENKVTDRFIFPIAPKQISINESKIASVLKTSGGVVSLFNSTFNPLTITISGNFGRDFKMLVGNLKDKTNIKNDKWVDYFKDVKPFINPFLKTGFGAYNELKRIVRKSTQLSATGQPFQTIFYNLAFSEVYIVQILDFNSTMSDDQNTIHNFSMTMKAINYYSMKSFRNQKLKSISTSLKESLKRTKERVSVENFNKSEFSNIA